MAKATPITQPSREGCAPAEDKQMPPAGPPIAPVPPPKADKADLDEMLAVAEAAGLSAQVVGNAVRVDN